MGHSLRASALVPRSFLVQDINVDKNGMVITVRPVNSTNPCPCCGTNSHRIHSRYRRHLADLPMADRHVRIIVAARRFHCDIVMCGQQIFAERFADDVLAPSARRTARLDITIHHLASIILGWFWEDDQRQVLPGG